MICATRSRPDMTKKMIKSWKDTQSGLSDMVIMLDDDDPELDKYDVEGVFKEVTDTARKMVREGGCGIKFPRGSAQLNQKAYEMYPDYKYYGLVGDDTIFRTKDWDKIVIDRFKEVGDFGMIYGDDLGCHKPVMPFITANLIKLVGYLVPPKFIHMRIDRIWWDITKYSNNIHSVPIVMEHMHPHWGKGEYDDTYDTMRSLRLDRHDKTAYLLWERDELPKILDKIKLCIK